ncbi:MATE family efflux transporter [Pseudoalteromonas lipolytica]|nr:hypothetical protein [Pseudoalteromonas lipolytica]
MKNFAFVIFSNLISLLISVFVILVIPKYIGVADYGYFQLYIFYTMFVGFMHFGINDGLYLRVGGVDYCSIDKKSFFSQYYLLFVFQLILAFLSLIFFTFSDFEHEKKFIIYMTLICMVVVNTRYMLLFTLQATYRIKEYSVITIFDRTSFLISVFLLLIFNFENFQFFIYADLTSKFLSLFLASYYCKDIVFRGFNDFDLKHALGQLVLNAKVGVKLMLSNIASKMIIGNVRLAIEVAWSVVVFGKISLMLSITGFVMIFINSIGLVLFPFLRRVDSSKLNAIYKVLRNALSVFLLFFLFFYYPVSSFLKYWLVDYKDVLIYLYIIFPIVVFEGKMSLLVNTYLKVLRKEKVLLKVNFLTVIVSLVVTSISVFVIGDLEVALYGILFVTAFRVVIFELYIERFLVIDLKKSIFLEVFVVFYFLFVNRMYSQYASFILYCALMLLVIFMARKSIFRLKELFFKRDGA